MFPSPLVFPQLGFEHRTRCQFIHDLQPRSAPQALHQRNASQLQAEVRSMVVALNQSLYEEFGLQGNQADYYNPEPGLENGWAGGQGVQQQEWFLWRPILGGETELGEIAHPEMDQQKWLSFQTALETDCNLMAGTAAISKTKHIETLAVHSPLEFWFPVSHHWPFLLLLLPRNRMKQCLARRHPQSINYLRRRQGLEDNLVHSFFVLFQSSPGFVPRLGELHAALSAVQEERHSHLIVRGSLVVAYLGLGEPAQMVWAAVARRCGLTCHPLANVPRHVLIRIPAAGEEGTTADLGDASPAVAAENFHG
eukprot:Skav233639  [mRNA]  locus=scaffold2779:282453:284444:+ [translate_table: standard]